MKTPLTKARIRHHLTYCSWMYVLLAVLSVFVWNIYFTSTAYRPPEEKKVILYVYASGDEVPLNTYIDQINQTEMVDMEEMNAVISVPDETYGTMVIMAHVAAGEGDLYIMDKNYYQSYASEGLFVPLDELPQVAALMEDHATAIERAYRRNGETNERHLYGIPLSLLPGMSEYVYTGNVECYLSVAVNSNNDENAMKLFEILLRDMGNLPMPTGETAEAAQ